MMNELQNEIYRLDYDKFTICSELLRHMALQPWISQALFWHHNYETFRYNDVIGLLYTEIDHLEVDKEFFSHKIGILKASSGVDDPPPWGQGNFMTLDNLKKSSSISNFLHRG